MKHRIETALVALALSTATVAFAAASPALPADAPAGTTGLCKDGSYSTAAAKKGACKGHKGVKDWYAPAPAKDAKDATESKDSKDDKGGKEAKHAKDAKDKVASGTPPASAPVTPSSAPTPPAGAPVTPSSSPTPAKSASAPAPGGGPGMVWVNTDSKVYHCQGDRWYGKTKQGQYLSESEAKAKGNRPEHGKACS